jgi:hypothetical protein
MIGHDYVMSNIHVKFTTNHTHGIVVKVICNCVYNVFYNCSHNGHSHGNTSNNPQHATWHQELNKKHFWPNNMVSCDSQS